MLISCIMHDTVGCMVICFNIRTHRQAVFIFARSFSGFLASIKFSNAHARTLGTQCSSTGTQCWPHLGTNGQAIPSQINSNPSICTGGEQIHTWKWCEIAHRDAGKPPRPNNMSTAGGLRNVRLNPCTLCTARGASGIAYRLR